MNKDYMSMAQTGQTPLDKEKLKNITPTEEDYKELGLPSGQNPEDAKKRFLAMFEELGILKSLTPDGLRELMTQLDDFIKQLQTKDITELQNHPIAQLLQQVQQSVMQMQQQQQPTGSPVTQQGVPSKDFASMMPPTPGGGMNGR